MASKVNAKQNAMIALLISGTPVVEACKRVGVTRETLSRWRSQPAFAAAMEQQQQALLEEGRTVALARLERIVTVLDDMLTDPAIPPSTRVAAARALLQYIGTPAAPRTSDTQTVVIVEDEAGG